MTTFDPVGIVIDWLDACRTGELDALLQLYDPSAAVECLCYPPRPWQGLSGLREYWQKRLANPTKGSLKIEELSVEGESIVLLDCESGRAKTCRMEFSFNEAGKIFRTKCGPV